ncbi:hypothetical protein [Burkholderia ubonensis]
MLILTAIELHRVFALATHKLLLPQDARVDQSRARTRRMGKAQSALADS